MTNEINIKPWLRLYPADYLADTQHLSTEEHGAYLLLIFNYWVKGGALPDDDEYLRKICKISRHKWKKFSPIIRSFFMEKDGKIYHKRIEAELAKSIELSKKRKEYGSKGGVAKATAKAKQNESNSTSKDVEGQGQGQGQEDNKDLNTCDFDEFWNNYPRKTDRKKAKPAFNRLTTKEKEIATKDCLSRFTNTEKRYIPHPSTYINGKRWNDEVIVHENSKPSSQSRAGKVAGKLEEIARRDIEENGFTETLDR